MLATAAFDPDVATLTDLKRGLASRRHSIPDREHRSIIERVIEAYRAAKRDQPAAPAPYQPQGEWASYLAERREFYDAMHAGHTAAVWAKIETFWRNELGPIVKEYARFEDLADGRADCVERFRSGIVRNFQIWKDIVGRPTTELVVPDIGNPWGLIIEGQLVVPKATRFHTHAIMIRHILSGVPKPVVADIGGGYGGIAYYLLRDGDGMTYVDYDLPETLSLASYYLLACFPDRKCLLYGEGDLTDTTTMQAFDIVLLPNYALQHLGERSVDMFLNTFSLSEVPRITLEEYLRRIQHAVRHYFLHNNMDRVGVINRGYERIPASAFPIDSAVLKLIYKHFDLFHGQQGDYKEFLYERIDRKC